MAYSEGFKSTLQTKKPGYPKFDCEICVYKMLYFILIQLRLVIFFLKTYSNKNI